MPKPKPGPKAAPTLFCFSSHGSPSTFWRGSEGEAQVLCGMMNRHRAIDVFSFRPVTEGEVGIEPVHSIKAELDRSAAVIKAAVDKHPTVAR
jgi:hypothetical protein